MFMLRKLPVSIAFVLVLTMLMTLSASAQEAALGGSANFRDANATSDSLEVSLSDATVLSAGSAYEGWLVDVAGNKISTGTYGVGPDLTGTYVDAEGRDLLSRYTTFHLTIEPNPDSDSSSSGVIAYGDAIPAAVSASIAQLIGNASSVQAAAQAASASAVSAEAASSLADKQSHAQSAADSLAVVIAGAAVLASDAAGAKSAAGGDELIEDVADELADAANNTSDLAGRAQAAALRVVGATTDNIAVDLDLDNLVALGAKVLNGTDADGSGVAGDAGAEGGAAKGYTLAQDLGQFEPGLGTPPATGDGMIPFLAMIVLMAGLVLASGGGLLVFRARRSVS